jgi:predicted secreted protein
MSDKNIVRLAKEFVVKVNEMVIARCTDFSFSIDKTVVDISSFDSNGFDEFLGDTKNWTISFGSMVTRDATAGEDTGEHGATGLGSGVFNNLFDHMIDSDSDYPVAIGLGDIDTTSQFFEGVGILQNLSFDGAQGDKVTYSGEIQGSGKIERG